MTDIQTNAAWRSAQRLEEWAGEIRVNLVRLVAIAVFYSRHLVEYFIAPKDAPVRGIYHAQVTWVILVWAAVALVVHIWLQRRTVLPTLKYAAVAWDAALVTLLCMLNGGPKSPLVWLLVLVIASAPLRLSLRLVWFAAACAMLGYLVILGHYAWYQIGFEKYYATPELRIPRSQEIITLLTLLTTALFAGQSIRQARRLVAGYPVIAAASTDSSSNG